MNHRLSLEGDGWFNVRELRLAGSDAPLNVSWTDITKWETIVPLAQGEQSITLEAIDFQGNVLATTSVTITSTTSNPVDELFKISELSYNPIDPSAAELGVDPSLEDGDFEFVEFVNVGDQPINLLGVYFSDGIDFVFPDAILGANETIVVARNPDAFQVRYGDVGGQVLGPYSGRLDNGGERIAISNSNGETIIEFEYDDDAPWPTTPDGDGDSLHSTAPSSALPGLAASWLARSPSPGAQDSRSADLNQDGEINASDIDRLCLAVSNSETEFDLNGDGIVDLADRDLLLAMMGSTMGDANLDGIFNSSDLVDVLIAGEYEDDIQGNSGWAEGDWNCDGDFNTQDFVAALERGTYTSD